ncbi:MAG: S8 family serine peptidase [Alteromonadaceae bacterium]|nr:S8 family serine peptidase [Alteromonadaceae bacterium]
MGYESMVSTEKVCQINNVICERICNFVVGILLFTYSFSYSEKALGSAKEIPIELSSGTCWYKHPNNRLNISDNVRLYNSECFPKEVLMNKSVVIETLNDLSVEESIKILGLQEQITNDISIETLVNYTFQQNLINVYLAEFRHETAVKKLLEHWHSYKQKPNRDKRISSISPDLIIVQRDRLKKNPLALKLKTEPLNFDANSVYLNKNLWGDSPGRGVNVAIIDDGFYLHHPAFCDVDILESWDADMRIPGAVPEKDYSHGSQVAAIVVGKKPRKDSCYPTFSGSDVNTTRSIVGVANSANLIAIKLTEARLSNIISAFVRAEKSKAHVINISWLLDEVMLPLKTYLEYLTTSTNKGKGIAIVVAATPSYQENKGLAACCNHITATAIDYKGMLANASADEYVDISELGFVYTTDFSRRANYSLFLKTSAATPIVTSFVAIIRQRFPNKTAIEVKDVLVSFTKGHSTEYLNTVISWQTLDHAKLGAFLRNEITN